MMIKRFIKSIRSRISHYSLKDYNFILFFAVIILAIIGITSIRATAPSLATKQTLGLLIGIIMMGIFSLLSYKFITSYTKILYIFAILMLAAVLVLGINVNNSVRWFSLGGLGTFQPSELAKVIFIVCIAKFVTDNKHKINRFSTLIYYLIVMLIPVVFIYREPDLSTCLVFVFVALIVLFVGGLSYKIIGIFFAIIIPVIGFLLWLIQQPWQPIFAEHQVQRVMTFLNPSAYLTTTYYQQYNSVMAIGSGMLTGKSVAEGAASVTGANYLYEPQNDFIFAVIGEKYGFVGAVIVIILLLIVVIECLKVAMKCSDNIGRLIAVGVATMIAFQVFVNIGVATAILPNTGLPLPFISYGLSSLVSYMIAIGLVLNVGLHRSRR